MATCFITGIDTGIGKSWATGAWANHLINQGRTVITAKLVQTGGHGLSEDILLHRKLMQMPVHDLDRDGTTCPYVFSLPASPHLAAARENRVIDCALLDDNLERLNQVYDTVLLEGAGGLLVPIMPDYSTLDFIHDRRLPVMVVTSPRLGSINHTRLTVDRLLAHNTEVVGMVFNLADTAAPEIADESKQYIQRLYPDIPLVDMPVIEDPSALPAIAFSRFLFPK